MRFSVSPFPVRKKLKVQQTKGQARGVLSVQIIKSSVGRGLRRSTQAAPASGQDQLCLQSSWQILLCPFLKGLQQQSLCSPQAIPSCASLSFPSECFPWWPDKISLAVIKAHATSLHEVVSTAHSLSAAAFGIIWRLLSLFTFSPQKAPNVFSSQ